MSGFAVIAALLVLQQPDGTTDSLKVREYITIGGTEMAGGYKVVTRVGPRLTTLRKHVHRVSGVSAGWRHETPNWSFGLRGQFFTGSDNTSRKEVVSGFLPLADSGTASTAPVHGGAMMLDFDGTYFGLSGGVVAGTLVKHRGDHTEGLPSPIGAGAVRIGVLSQFYGEVAIFDHDPAPVPGSQLKVSASFVDDRGSRYRVGFADAAPFGECRVLIKHGFEVTPFFSGGDNGGFNFRLSVAWRLSVKR